MPATKNNNNPYTPNGKPSAPKKKSSGKRVGKSKPEKSDNQLNRRVK